jgi:dipeptidyl-peptidase-4
MNIARRVLTAVLAASVLASAEDRANLVLAAIPLLAQAPKAFSLEQILGYPFAYELVSARKADRVAWLEFERGRRNVYTAAAPDFRPVRLTSFMDDDGMELTNLRISDDGARVVFVRGSDPNREGWTANPNQAPDGSEQAIWAATTREGRPRRIAAGGGPRLSPDGRLVVYEKDGQIYGASVGAPAESAAPAEKNAAPLFRTWGTNRAPVFAPDGARVAFVSDRKDHCLIGVYEIASRRIVYMAPSVDKDASPTWSGDGMRIAFIRRPGPPFAQITAAALAEARAGRPAEAPPAAAPAQTATDRPSPAPAAQSAAPAIGPGFQASKFEDGRVLTIWTAAADTGQGELAWREPLDDPAFRPLAAIRWAGDSLIFELERNNWRHYFAVPASGGLDAAPIDLTPGPGETEFINLSADGRTLFYTSNAGDIDRRHLWRAPTAGGLPPVQLTKGEGIETEAAPLASGGQVAVFYADARRPRAVALVPAEGGAARVIETNLSSDFPAAAHVPPESVVLKAADGLEFHSQIFVPKDIRPGEKRPALLFTHGGPIRQMLLGYHYMFFYHMAYAVNQYFADRGYVVISVNYRSGIGYGREFRQAPNRGAGGSSEYQDVLAAARYLQSRPDVDPGRIGLWGLSYGGLLTALGLSRNSDVFKAGVDIAGVHLWGNSLDTNSTAFKASAVATIDQWTSPVLLIQGDDDRNVAFSQTTGLVQLLRARKIPHELIVFPDEVHDFLVYAKWLRVFHAAEDFFQRMLGNARPGTATSPSDRSTP